MIDNQVGRRYAEAIYEIAESTDKVKPIYEKLNTLMELYKNDDEFKTFITHPLIEEDEKKKVLSSIFKDSDEGILNIMFYILDKKRIENIRNIVAEYLKIYYEKNQILDVEATFAVEPSELQKKKLIEKLMKKKEIPFNLQLDKENFFGSPLDIYLKILEVWNDKENILKWEELVRRLPKSYLYSVLDIVKRRESDDALLNKIIMISNKISHYSIDEILDKCEKLTFEILKIKTTFSREEVNFFKTVKNSIKKTEDLETYIMEVKNILNAEKKITKGKISILSVHSSKGLEWEAVFIPTLLEGIFPSDIGEKNIEEEKRLFYVACSRGKKYLYLLYPEYFYEKVGYFNKKSSFLK